VSAFGNGTAPYPPVQNGKEKRGGLLLPADYARIMTAAERAKLATLWTVRLNYDASTEAADLGNATAIAASTWTDLCANKSFTVGDATALVEIDVRGVCVGPNAASLANIASRLVVDGTPAPGLLGGGAPAAGQFHNFLAGNGTVKYGGLAAGAHTVRVQIWTNVAGTYFCRAKTQPNFEALTILVVERR
jgi:hypothetical protein